MALIRSKATGSITWWVGVATGVIAAWALVEGRSYGVAGIMPSVAAAAILGLSILHTVNGLLFGVVANDDDWHSEAERAAYHRRRMQYGGIVLAVVLGGWIIGFHAALPIFVILFIGLTLGRWILGAILAASIWCFTYLILSQILHTSFPPTLLQRWLVAAGIF